MSSEFDPVYTQLETGFTVIEASAGTGKTTTISAIVLRLIAEQHVPIEKILVATYTELATAELRGRIREIISDALRSARGGAAQAPFVRAIVEKASDRKGLINRLELALHNFDEAPVFTIHGFCGRVLADRAFESGVTFDTQLTTEQSRFLHEVADDFWRAHFYTVDAVIAKVIRDRIKPQRLVDLLEQLTRNPTMRVLPAENLGTLEKKIASIWTERGDCDELSELADGYVVSLQSQFCDWAVEELRRRKADRRVQSFDDMLTRLDTALLSEHGELLRKSLRERFAVALIDEFQDTDPVQYSIFLRIFGESDAPVFLIGDPKQAIYGFRGADLFTYLRAARIARRRYTLGKNWRSEAKLVKGVSALFGARRNAFVIPGIDLSPVNASGQGDAEPFAYGGVRDEPLRFWIASSDDRKRKAVVVAAEIARLLTGDARIGSQKVKARDIAVLVTNNTQPAEIQDALANYRIPSVVYSAAIVFKSREATELMFVLLAVAQPTREGIVRAALATEMLGLNAGDLENLLGDETQWEDKLNRFAEYHALWRDRGFVAMMRKLLVREKIRGRFLRLRDGERRLTNLLHLIELVHAACAQNRLGIDGVITWLRRQISDSGEGREEYELRLESDEDAVRIVTIHKSKGLEWGITFCPFARKEPWRGGQEFLKFHQGEELVLDLTESSANKKIRAREELAESVRQLYVGLTRAKHRSYVIWQESRQRSKSAMGWLFSNETSADTFLENGASISEANFPFAKNELIAVEALPEHEGKMSVAVNAVAPVLQPRIFDSEIDRSWRISSFSSLISGQARESEAPDYDSSETEIEPLAPLDGIHAFPRGTRAGTCLHKILEEMDFQERSKWRPLVSEKLSQFRINGFDETILKTVSNVLAAPLRPDGFTLTEIGTRIPELEFTFAVSALTTARLRSVFQLGELPVWIDRLQFSPASGFMKGYIDLVFEHEGKFYFVDWKSNWLGPDIRSYSPESIAVEMARSFYHLQLSIYGVALHRYLRQRLTSYNYERNFGGAFYVFLRGVDAVNPVSGIFQSRPSLNFIERLDRIFHGGN